MLVSRRHHRSVGDPWAPATPWDPGRHSRLFSRAGLTSRDDAKGPLAASASLITPGLIHHIRQGKANNLDNCKPFTIAFSAPGQQPISPWCLTRISTRFPWLKDRGRVITTYVNSAADEPVPLIPQWPSLRVLSPLGPEEENWSSRIFINTKVQVNRAISSDALSFELVPFQVVLSPIPSSTVT
ncbi:uncharacterized protein CLUP02_05089 [Colletotrichum lupini]|uniref:Uncharacterized protein n=1 Tax=Colletotrichum lupini TaxID=145971 RepID=A0A9Q8SLJ2_9PEZI|nr:uncharacterized protein CLUP02_05089 [Colletotrichum lupini]UQC79609.1 hypothetical protein CLUP02_05089 [Colletotrichum lupini]